MTGLLNIWKGLQFCTDCMEYSERSTCIGQFQIMWGLKYILPGRLSIVLELLVLKYKSTSYYSTLAIVLMEFRANSDLSLSGSTQHLMIYHN